MPGRLWQTALSSRLYSSVPCSSRAITVAGHSLTLAKDAKARIAQTDLKNPFHHPLVDGFNRKHDYLRISLTEKCNLRCFYCMPSEGIELSPKEHILNDDEIVRLATIFVRHGVKKIRLTGGEPTIRKGLDELIGRLNELKSLGLLSIGMTSNGLVLPRRLKILVDKGLTHLNLSLDTLDPLKYELITRRQGHDAVIKTLDLALAEPRLQAVKLNVVVMKDLNENEVVDFVRLTENEKVSVRFIEFMPFTGNSWKKDRMVPSSQLLGMIQSNYPVIHKAHDDLNDTARSYTIPGHKGSFGFISSMSDHFCASCNRLRLTADGQIKVCLFDSTEMSLRDALRSGASDDAISAIVSTALGGKQEKHSGMDSIDVVNNRPMILIDPTRPTHTCTLSSHSKIFPAIAQALHYQVPRSRFLPFQRTRAFPVININPGTLSYTRTLSSRSESRGALTHIGEDGRPAMVHIGDKDVTRRRATASGRIILTKDAFELLSTSDDSTSSSSPLIIDGVRSPVDEHKAKARSKGNVLLVAQLAAIMACKRTSSLIPLCHPVLITDVQVLLLPELEELSVSCKATVQCDGKTGVEMEALTAVSVGLLTVWDMVKAVAGKEMTITDIKVTSKSGGKNGDWERTRDI